MCYNDCNTKNKIQIKEKRGHVKEVRNAFLFIMMVWNLLSVSQSQSFDLTDYNLGPILFFYYLPNYLLLYL